MKVIKMLKAGLSALIVLTLVMFSSSSIYAAGKKAEKVEMCHKGSVILVSGNAAKAHLDHGDLEVFVKDGNSCHEYVLGESDSGTVAEPEPVTEPEPAPSFNFSW